MTLKTKIHWMNFALAGALAVGLAAVGCGDDSKPATDAAVGDGSAGGADGSAGAGGSAAGGAGGNTARGGAGGGSAGAGGSGAGGSGGGMAGDAAAGGSSGDAAAGGAGGSGSDAAAACNIPCLQNLFAQCPAEGACTESESGTFPVSFTTNSCYTNGVKTQVSLGVTGGAFRFFKPGGAACVSFEIAAADLLTGNSTIKDGAGATIATITVNPMTMKETITCTATGMSYDASLCSDVPSVDMSGMPETMCTAGPCTIP